MSNRNNVMDDVPAALPAKPVKIIDQTFRGQSPNLKTGNSS